MFQITFFFFCSSVIFISRSSADYPPYPPKVIVFFKSSPYYLHKTENSILFQALILKVDPEFSSDIPKFCKLNNLTMEMQFFYLNESFLIKKYQR